MDESLANEENKTIFLVDETSDLPIWVQLRNRMAYLIRTGSIQPGEQLPSVRSLAADAKINYNTVTKAYRDLELSNLIVSVRGRGMYVRKDVAIEESPEDAVDTLIESCIHKYLGLGMTFDDARSRMDGIAQRIETESREKADEKTGYYDEKG